MAQCQGTTKSGNRCRLDAQPGSDFCHLHGAAKDKAPHQGEGAADVFQLEELMPIVVVGAVLVGALILSKTVFKFLPKF